MMSCRSERTEAETASLQSYFNDMRTTTRSHARQVCRAIKCNNLPNRVILTICLLKLPVRQVGRSKCGNETTRSRDSNKFSEMSVPPVAKPKMRNCHCRTRRICHQKFICQRNSLTRSRDANTNSNYDGICHKRGELPTDLLPLSFYF